MDNKLFIPSIFFSVLTLSACGGSSGGDSSDGSVDFTVATPINMSSVNANEAAAEGAASTASTTIGGAAKGSVQSQKTNSRIVNIVSNFKDKSKLRNKVISNGPEACNVSGSRESSYDDETFAFSITFNNCSEYGELMNGSLTGSFSEGAVSTVFTMIFSNFSINSTSLSDPFAMSMNGKMVMTTTEFLSFDRNFLNGNDMLINMSYSGRSVSLGNYTMTYDDYYFSSYDISTFEYDMNSTELGGSLRVVTTEAVYQNYSDDYPYAGKVKLTGANNASILITILDSSNITVEEDIDGNGIYESSTNITWSELYNFL